LHDLVMTADGERSDHGRLRVYVIVTGCGASTQAHKWRH
jgi:hypothetical protein